MSREFYQYDWGREKNRWNQYNNENNYSDRGPINIDAYSNYDKYSEGIDIQDNDDFYRSINNYRNYDTRDTDCSYNKDNEGDTDYNSDNENSYDVDCNCNTNYNNYNGNKDNSDGKYDKESSYTTSSSYDDEDHYGDQNSYDDKDSYDDKNNNDDKDGYDNNQKECDYKDTQKSSEDNPMIDTRVWEKKDKRNRKKKSAYEEVKEAPLKGKSKTKCCPFDAYGINTYSPNYTKINVVKDYIEDLYIPFTVSVTVPVGFVLPMGCQYRSSLAMDQHDLSINTMTQYYVYADVSDCGCESPEVVKMQISVLNGPIYYNVTVENFVPAQQIQDVNQPCTVYLNGSGSLAIDKILAYAPFGYQAAPLYSIDIIEEKESIVLPGGKCVTKQTGCEEYSCILANPDIERVLNFSYMLVVRTVSLV